MTPEQVAEYNEDALLADGFEKALIGVAERINLNQVRLTMVRFSR